MLAILIEPFADNIARLLLLRRSIVYLNLVPNIPIFYYSSTVTLLVFIVPWVERAII